MCVKCEVLDFDSQGIFIVPPSVSDGTCLIRATDFRREMVKTKGHRKTTTIYEEGRKSERTTRKTRGGFYNLHKGEGELRETQRHLRRRTKRES